MKLLFLDAVTSGSSQEEIKYLEQYLSKDTILIADKVEKGLPSIQCEYDEAMSQPEVIKKCIKAEKNGMDGIFINCFGDPGVRPAREAVNIPVFGGFEPVMHTALGLGDRIAILSVLENVIPMNRNIVARSKLEGRVSYMGNINIPVADLDDVEKVIDAAALESIKAIKNTSAEVIILGCTGMIAIAKKIEGRLAKEGYDVPVLEAAQIGVSYLEMCVRLGLCQSRRTYMPILQ